VPRKLEIDWVIVSKAALRRTVALGLTLLLAAGLAALGYRLLHQPPQVVARRAIQRAERTLARAREHTGRATWQRELEQASAQLERARSAYADERWDVAREEAEQARRRLELLLGSLHREMPGVGQIVSVEGKVAVQRAGSSDWTGARERMPLYNGDFVRTGADGAAEILFADGTLYRVAPNSLLEISRSQPTRGSSRVSMVVGEVNVYTTDGTAAVDTTGAEARVRSKSRVRVGVAGSERRTVVAAYEGGVRVTARDGATVELGPREAVTAGADGALGEKRRLPAPPSPLAPPSNATYTLGGEQVIELAWRLPPDAVASHLQVSRSRLFLPGALDVDAPRRTKPRARLRPVQPGTYYWRVAAVGEGGVESEWSRPRRFRILGSGRAAVVLDRTPPELELEPLRQMGHYFLVEGRTEPGATVRINDEEVVVDADGRFQKTVEATRAGWNEVTVVATDPAGNQTERRERVYVEVF